MPQTQGFAGRACAATLCLGGPLGVQPVMQAQVRKQQLMWKQGDLWTAAASQLGHQIVDAVLQTHKCKLRPSALHRAQMHDQRQPA